MTAAASPIRTGSQRGFTYASVVILVAIIGLVGAFSLRLGSSLQRVYAEQALLDIGTEYSNALASYAAATPQGQPNYPKSFAELLKDPRFPQLKRHLRRIYVDPMTGKAEWGLVKATENGGILGIYSLSKAVPIKVGNFPARFAAFEGRTSFADWKFSGEGVQVPGKGADGQQAGQQPGQQPGLPSKPGAGLPPGGMTGTPPGSPVGGKSGTQQEPSKSESPQPAPEPQPPQEAPPEPQDPPPEPQEQRQDQPADEPPAPSPGG